MKPVIWKERFTVNSHDTDFCGNVRPSVMLRYLQEACNLEHRSCGPTLDELREHNQIFLLSKTGMRLYFPLRAFDPVEAEVWFAGLHGFSFLRSGRILSNGTVIAEMHSVWAMLDISDPDHRRFIRKGFCEFGFGSGEPLSLGFPARLRIPQELPLTDAGSRRIVYADCDVNRHMNNTNYPDMFVGCLPEYPGRVTEFEIAYLSEAPMGESVRLLWGKAPDGSVYFRSLRQDGTVNAEARMRFEEAPQ